MNNLNFKKASNQNDKEFYEKKINDINVKFEKLQEENKKIVENNNSLQNENKVFIFIRINFKENSLF